MPDFETHFIVGGLTAVCVLANARKNRNELMDFAETLSIFLGGGAVASLPDVFDPPTSPRHRSIGHSIVGSAGLGLAMKNLETNLDIPQNKKDVLYALGGAYLSHIALDATTPAGLPFISNDTLDTD